MRTDIARRLPFTCILFVLIQQSPAAGQTLNSAIDEYVGGYRVAPHGTMSVSRFSHGDETTFLFTDFSDGWRGALVPGTADTLLIVPRHGDSSAGRPRLRLTRDRGGNPMIELHTEERPVRKGRMLPLRSDPVTFRNGEVVLAGEIVRPAGNGPHPGVVFVHGSGPATRNDYREWSYFFASNGFAVLIYDKRGAGDSGGDYRRADFTVLADDAVEAVRTLRAHEDVDSLAVGLSGGSQGAWVTPIAENKLGGLVFLIPTGGGPVTPAVQEIYRRTRIVEDEGFAAATVATAREIVTVYFDYLGSGGRSDSLRRRVSDLWASHGEEPWFPLLDLPSSDPTVGEWPEGRKRFASELFFDANPYVSAISTPTLAILGSEDQGFPTGRTAESWRALVKTELLTLWIIPGVDHGFWVTDDPIRGRHQSPQLFSGMLSWMLDQLQNHRPIDR